MYDIGIATFFVISLVAVRSRCNVVTAAGNIRHAGVMAEGGNAAPEQLPGDLEALPANQRDAIEEYLNRLCQPVRKVRSEQISRRRFDSTEFIITCKYGQEISGIGSGNQNSMICAFCRRHNFLECIQRFCNDSSIHRLRSGRNILRRRLSENNRRDNSQE